MSNVDRIQKFCDDQISVITTCKGKPNKITAEIDKLRQWLVKHQEVVVPDGAKAQIFSILEKYQRCFTSVYPEIMPAVSTLFSDYLQLPEGKLLSSKSKQRVLKWLQQMDNSENGKSESVEQMIKRQGETLSTWSVEGVDEKNQRVTLLSTTDAEVWKEDFHVPSKNHFQQLVELRSIATNEGSSSGGGHGGHGHEKQVLVELNGCDEVTRVMLEEEKIRQRED